MKEAGYATIGFGIGTLLLLALYFFWHVPEIDKSYKRGLNQCAKDTDTLYIPGKDSIIYRDKIIIVEKPVEVENNDTSLVLTAKNDTSFVSGKDTITTKTKVDISVKKKDGEWDLSGVKARWIEKIEHKDFTQTPDTVKITVPKYIEIIKTETNWLVSGITYIAGVLSAIAIFFMAK